MKNRFKALATIGLAAALSLGVSACGSDSDPEDPTGDGGSSESAECKEVREGSKWLSTTENIGQVYASPVPEGVDADSSTNEFMDAEYSDTRYVVGWKRTPETYDGESLEDVKIATYAGTPSEGCEITSLEGSKVEKGDQSWDLFSLVGSDAPTDARNAYISFKNPDAPDDRVSVKLWNLSEGMSLSNNELQLVMALGNELS